MTSGLVNASFSLPEWKAVKVIFFAPWVRTFIFFDVWVETPWVLLPSLNAERSLCKMLKLKQIVPVQSTTKRVSCGWSHKRISTTHSKVRADIEDSIIHQAILIPGWSYTRLTLSERSLDDSSSQKKNCRSNKVDVFWPVWSFGGEPSYLQSPLLFLDLPLRFAADTSCDKLYSYPEKLEVLSQTYSISI